jgi:chemotaxis protein methyltransferase CheR
MTDKLIDLTKEEFEALSNFIQKECGIVIEEDKAYLIQSKLLKLVIENGCESFSDFFKIMSNDITQALRTKVIDAMTTNETLWFRDNKPWGVIKDIIIPKLIDDLQKGKRKRINIWCAAASTGQEPYSLAMLIHEAIAYNDLVKPEQFQILATDISATALRLAIVGKYNNIIMSRGMIPEYQERYFLQENGIFTIDNCIKSMVTFKRFNLMDDFNRLPMFDIVFCRNVAIYFSLEHKLKLWKKIYDRLNVDGIFFIGASESLIGYSDDFDMFEYQKSIYYKPKK